MIRRSPRPFVAIVAVATFAACATPSAAPAARREPIERQESSSDAPARGGPSPGTSTESVPTAPDETQTGLGATDLDGIGGACRGEHACVLVRPPCGDVGSAPRARAREIQARYDEIASVAECAAPRPVVPVEPHCASDGCSVHPRAHPEVLRCSADGDCAPFEWGCRWSTVARSHEREARRLMPIGPACPGILPVEPEVRCTFGFCSLGVDAIPR